MIGLVDPAVFVALGETLESARALALQAERAEVLRVAPVREPGRWFTHRVLPVCPYPPDSRGLEQDPWSVGGGLGGYDPAPHFEEGVLYRILHRMRLRSPQDAGPFGPSMGRNWNPWAIGSYLERLASAARRRGASR